MKKIELLAETSIISRVEIDISDNANEFLSSEETITKASKAVIGKIKALDWTDIYENIVSIEEDTECPYTPQKD